MVYEVDSEMAPFTASVSLTPDTLFGSPALSKPLSVQIQAVLFFSTYSDLSYLPE